MRRRVVFFVVPQGATQDTKLTQMGSRSKGVVVNIPAAMAVTFGTLGDWTLRDNYRYDEATFVHLPTGATQPMINFFEDLDCGVSHVMV